MGDVTGSVSRLDGQVVLVTREADKAAETARVIEERGGIPLVFSAIETVPPEDLGPLYDAVRSLDSYDWVAFPSRTAVAALVRACADLGVSLERSGRPRFAAVGEGTARALADHGIRDVVVPAATRRDAQGLAEVLIRLGVAGARVLIPRAEQGREVLATALREAGASVSEVVAYRTLPRAVPEDEVKALLGGPRPDAALFFSPSAFHGLLNALGADRARAFLSGVILCAIGRTTARAMSDAGLPPDTIAAAPSVEAALDAVARPARR